MRSLQGRYHGGSKGVGKATHADRAIHDAYGAGPIVDEINPRDPDFDPAEYIPEIGSQRPIRYPEPDLQMYS